MARYRKTVLSLPAPRPGADHRLTLFLPDGPAPAAGRATLWYLDGNAAAQDLDAATLDAIPGPGAPVLICLGHEGAERFASLERTRDYTPEGQATDPRGRPAGGAPSFWQRLTEQLIPAAEAHFTADPTARQLWGHSYGGLFVLRAALLAGPPNLFSGFIAASPALWWNHAGYLARLHAALEAGQRPQAPIAFHTGGAERERASQPSDPTAQPLLKMRAALPPDALEGLVAAFARAGNPGAFTVFPGLSHGETFTRSVRVAALAAGADPGVTGQA
ncbi:alpha/beta hydrolase-fold protein [Pseudooceanicola sp. HF7]|uniref:alpha/beta hydrolase n=1 Tax=Pseudooceanicola sp. HF7 TaxID=2721560 RepID=UPI00142F7836|nr:alpha/beta hydrolase [Pseudooceanicola sp. HF7]